MDGNVSESSGLGDSFGSEQPRIHRKNASIDKVGRYWRENINKTIGLKHFRDLL